MEILLIKIIYAIGVGFSVGLIVSLIYNTIKIRRRKKWYDYKGRDMNLVEASIVSSTDPPPKRMEIN